MPGLGQDGTGVTFSCIMSLASCVNFRQFLYFTHFQLP